jgi:hypothetical protein
VSISGRLAPAGGRLVARLLNRQLQLRRSATSDADDASPTHRSTTTACHSSPSAYPPGASTPSTTGAASDWPGAFTGGPEPTIWRRPVVLCLGDSITQMGSDEYDRQPGWVLRLAAHFNRKVALGPLRGALSAQHTHFSNVARLTVGRAHTG